MGWLVAVGIVAGLACAAAAPAPGPLVAPPDRAVVFWGTLDLIARADGPLKVDGKSQAWDAFALPLRVARLGLEPGPHKIEIGSHRADLFVSLGPDERDWPEGWQPRYSHLPENGPERCGGCHKVARREGLAEVGRWKGATACSTCHRQRDLEDAHCRPLKEIHSCPTCHDLHAATRKGLLRAKP